MKINLIAPINSLGYGVCGLNILNELSKEHHVSYWPLGNIEAPKEFFPIIKQGLDRQGEYNKNAPSIRLWHQFDLAQHVGKGSHCGFPIFELDAFNVRECHHLLRQDLLFVCSNWAKKVLVDLDFKEENIKVIPLGVDTNIFQPGEAIEKDTVFLNVGKWELRKGHDVLKVAFEKAFTKDDNVKLVMVCHNPCFQTQEEYVKYNKDWENYYQSSSLSDKIRVLKERVPTQQDLAQIMSCVDCGVFPSRAEGWNLDLCEMMAMGKEVICTNYSAHTEYCNSENSRLINIDKLEDAYDGIWFRGPGQWASFGESQIDQLVEHMRAVHKLKQEGNLKNKGNLIPNLTWANSAKTIIEALNERAEFICN